MEIKLADGWRLALGMPPAGWLIQELEGDRWFTRAVVTDRKDLLRQVGELCDCVDRETLAELERLPQHQLVREHR